MKTIILYGASGFIGSHIYKSLDRPGYHVIGTRFNKSISGLAYTDVTKYKHIEEDLLGMKEQYDYLIFAAGNKNRNASYKELYRDNTLPMKHIYKAIAKYKLKTRVIYISTDSVFDGQDGRNRDDLVPLAKSNYGKTKYLGEIALCPNAFWPEQPNGVDYRIVRTSAVIGEGSLFLSWLINNFKKGDPFKVRSNHYLSPTSIELLTNSIVYLIENWDKVKQPILHICGKRMSRYQFACLVAKASYYHPSLVCKDNRSPFQDVSMIPSEIQKKVPHQPMEQYLKELLCQC